MEQARLLELCRQGDEMAWEVLVRRYQGRIYAIAYHYTGNPEDARDLAQEIFVRLYRKLPACTDAGLFLPWMIRVARNACLDFLRRRKVRPPAQDIPAAEMADLPAVEPTPEETSLIASRKRLLHRALARLSLLSREVILLKEIEGLALEEIASLLEVPVGTVKSRVHRARLQLALQLLSAGGEGRR